MVAASLQGLPRSCQPTRPPQVFGTSTEEHTEAIERVRKAKVRPPLPGQTLTSMCLCGGGTGQGPVTSMLSRVSGGQLSLISLPHPSVHRPPRMP